ncbi:hypothetical protein HPB48_003069 [Haemaphysalis longicornis]|uniref:Uncharacterized protein n=1 Tax=Haemaphysalis longicornis TaxID=44386 RepID=A0A9J6FSB9_HAELO|nr:hypothetical protein HPB48_003069 [Haemaphysalis longicornis]
MEQVLGLVRLPYAPESCIERTTSALCKGFEFYFRWHTTIMNSCLPLGTYEQGPQKENQPEPALDGGLLKRMADIICTLVRSLEERCLPSFDKLAPLVSKLLAEPRPWMEHLHGLAIIGDILKLGPAACSRYSTCYLPGIVERLDSRVDSVRAAAARAVATLAERGGSAFAAECGRALPSLARAIQLPKPLFTEHSLSTELSIVALSRIMQNHWDTPEVKAGVNDLFPNLLHSLQSLGADTLGPPLELICSAVERNDGVAMEHAAHVFHVLQNTLARDEVAKDSALSKRVRACLQRLTLDPLPDESVRKALGVIYELFSTSEAEDDKT